MCRLSVTVAGLVSEVNARGWGCGGGGGEYIYPAKKFTRVLDVPFRG